MEVTNSSYTQQKRKEISSRIELQREEKTKAPKTERTLLAP
jgi:hypothetical protein